MSFEPIQFVDTTNTIGNEYEASDEYDTSDTYDGAAFVNITDETELT